VVEDKVVETSTGHKYSNYSQQTSPPTREQKKSSWSPPKPAGKLFDQMKSPKTKPGSSVFSDFGKGKKDSFSTDDFWNTPQLGRGTTQNNEHMKDKTG